MTTTCPNCHGKGFVNHSPDPCDCAVSEGGGIVVEVCGPEGRRHIRVHDRRTGGSWWLILPSRHCIEFGDMVWWRSGRAYWTSACGQFKRRFNVPIPVTEVRVIQDQP